MSETNDNKGDTNKNGDGKKDSESNQQDPDVKHPEEAEEEDDERILWHNVSVGRPLSAAANVQQPPDDDYLLPLPVLSSAEPLESVQVALAETVLFCGLTNYTLVHEAATNTDPSTTATAKPDNASKSFWTTHPRIDMLATPAYSEDTSGVLLGGNSTLGSLLPKEQPTQTDAAHVLRMVLLPYNMQSVTSHIRTIQHLLIDIPTALRLVSETKSSKRETGTEQQETNDASMAETETAKTNNTDEKETSNKVTAKPNGKKPKLPDLKQYHSRDDLRVSHTNVKDFFYLVQGQERPPTKSKHSKKKRVDPWKKLNESDAAIRVLSETVSIVYSPYHPPPRFRILLGDLAYLQVNVSGGDHGSSTSTSTASVIHITACRMGFYVNKTNNLNNFDPSPHSTDPCYAHSLLECLQLASPIFTDLWKKALAAAQEKQTLLQSLSPKPHTFLFQTPLRGDTDGLLGASHARDISNPDGIAQAPTWLVPNPSKYNANDWTHHDTHTANPHRLQETLLQHNDQLYGDSSSGCLPRDWNEELQMSREMPTDTLLQRLERARFIHKVLTEFGQACVRGVVAIHQGQVTAMNPNEPNPKAHVYCFNGIFFSQAFDTGGETNKIYKGDGAARKTANRDIQCLGTFHRLESVGGWYTLNTVLIDYLGVRYSCQGVLPGILIGDRGHTVVYGAVEGGMPLKWDEDLHKLFEERIGKAMMVATRPMFERPLTLERITEINQEREAAALPALELDEDPNNAVIQTCLPLEAKGIRGSDQRTYVLDCSRLTPRDPNWLPQTLGGTGVMETVSVGDHIPSSLDDDEWVTNVLRSELVSQFTRTKLAKHVQERKQKEETTVGTNIENGTDASSSLSKTSSEEAAPSQSKTDEEAEETATEDNLHFLKGIRMNINVFLPNMRSFDGIDDEHSLQIKQDEELVREAGVYLWNEMLPRITKIVREGSVAQLAVDGQSLTEFLHRYGVNCRYMGRLAVLAKEQEDHDNQVAADIKAGRQTVIERRTMPKCWLELLECEMVARSAKHVLDEYLSENYGVAASQPAQTIASFLSALVSEAEESAAQTELRLDRRGPNQPDDDDVGALTITGIGSGDAVPKPVRGREEVWKDIEADIGRRFRYTLSIFNNGNKSGRALYIPLLRRVCQRAGVRLLAKEYDLGNKCVCGGSSTAGGRLILSYPISIMDIVDVVPLVKHTAAYGEGFGMCSVGTTVALPSLQVSLPDARATLERAHIQFQSRNLAVALELAQEAAGLYQRVTETATHPGVVDSIELMANILLEAGDSIGAAASCAKSLSLAIQTLGFDNPTVFNLHHQLFKMYFTSHEMDTAVKHIRAAIYLLEIMSGPHHSELYTLYHQLGMLYQSEHYNGKYNENALHCLEEACDRQTCDRLMEGFLAKNLGKVLETMTMYKDALEQEKRAFRVFNGFLGKDNQATKESDETLRNLTKLAVAKGNEEMMKKEEAPKGTEEGKKKKTKKKKGKK